MQPGTPDLEIPCTMWDKLLPPPTKFWDNHCDRRVIFESVIFYGTSGSSSISHAHPWYSIDLWYFSVFHGAGQNLCLSPRCIILSENVISGVTIPGMLLVIKQIFRWLRGGTLSHYLRFFALPRGSEGWPRVWPMYITYMIIQDCPKKSPITYIHFQRSASDDPIEVLICYYQKLPDVLGYLSLNQGVRGGSLWSHMKPPEMHGPRYAFYPKNPD